MSGILDTRIPTFSNSGKTVLEKQTMPDTDVWDDLKSSYNDYSGVVGRKVL